MLSDGSILGVAYTTNRTSRRPIWLSAHLLSDSGRSSKTSIEPFGTFQELAGGCSRAKAFQIHPPSPEASVARSAAMGELPALGRVKWRGPSLPENYTPPGGISKGHLEEMEQQG